MVGESLKLFSESLADLNMGSSADKLMMREALDVMGMVSRQLLWDLRAWSERMEDMRGLS